MLAQFLVSCGGSAQLLSGWRAKTEFRKGGDSAGTSDTYFYSATGKKFRSRAEVARHFKLQGAPQPRAKRAASKVALREVVGGTETDVQKAAEIHLRKESELKSEVALEASCGANHGPSADALASRAERERGSASDGHVSALAAVCQETAQPAAKRVKALPRQQGRQQRRQPGWQQKLPRQTEPTSEREADTSRPLAQVASVEPVRTPSEGGD